MELNKPIVFIRADGNSNIGLGHLVRCHALALMLKNNFKITFFCMEIPDIMVVELQANGLNCIIIEDEFNFISHIHDNCIVVIDGYQFSTDYQKLIKEKGAKLVCIDDLYNKEFVADLIINHTPGVSPQVYKSQPYTLFALGIEYALLRPVFLEQAKRKRRFDKIETVMICFGGSDHKGLTQCALQIALEFSQFKKIIVVTGAAFQSTQNFSSLLRSDYRIDYRSKLNEKQMLDAMLEAELAIVPSSGILFEVLATGCIVISGNYVDNQAILYENFRKLNLFIDAGNFSHKEIRDSITNSLNINYLKPEFHVENSSYLSNKLFSDLYIENSLKMRYAVATDIELTFSWATNPEIRRFSFQQQQITKSEHHNWFFRKITEINCHYFIIEYLNEPIGSIRFDISEGEACISYFIDPKHHGNGFGLILLKKGIENLLVSKRLKITPLKVICGLVMKNNIASIKSFQRLGFIKNEKANFYKFEKWL